MPHCALADDAVPESTTVQRTETVVVTASRPAADEIDTDFQTSSVSVVKVSDSGKSMATVADLLDREASVQVRQLAGLGSYSAVSIRGASADQVNVYLDGVLLNDAYGGSIDLSQFLLNNIDSIEIYRGGVPVQLGAAGIGGAINIKTKKADGEPIRQLELGYGSFESKKAATLFAGKTGLHNYQAALSYLSSDNDFGFLNNGQTPNNPFDDEHQKRRNAQFDQLSAMLTLSSKVDEQKNTTFVVQHEAKDKYTPNVANDTLNNATFDTRFTSVKAKLDETLTNTTSISYQLYGAHRESLYQDPDGRVGVASNDERAILDSLGMQLDYAQLINAHTVNVHAELDWQDYRDRDYFRDTRQEVERLRFRTGLQDEWLNDQGNLLITARAAYELNKDEDQVVQAADRTNEYFDGQLGIKYWLSPEWAVFSNVSRDIRTPKLFELYGDQGNSKGNDDLTEEYAINFDAGVSYKTSGLRFSTQLFYRDLDDAIVIIYDSQGTGVPINISSARIMGVEFEASVDLGGGFELSANATAQESENLSELPASRGNPLPGIYEQSFDTALSYTRAGYKVAFEYSHNSGGFYDSEGVEEKPSTDQIHLLNEFAWGDHKVLFRAENLTDDQVEHFNRFPSPGRRFFLTYIHQF